MIWIVGVLVILVIGGAAVAAAGRADGLAEEHPDRPDVVVPTDRPLRGEDLREVRFTSGLRGYRMDEVDALLERLAAQLDDQLDDRDPRRETPEDDPADGDTPGPGR